MKLLSIIIPIYNTKEYLEKCVTSIRKQSYENLEILLINDGSTDLSGPLCEKLALEDKRIRVFHKDNGGSSSARNMGIENAKGEYLAFVDSDDYIEREMYAYLMEAIVRTKVNIAQIGRIEERENGELLPEVCEIPYQEIIYESSEFIKELLLYRGDSSFCTKVFKKELFEIEKFPLGELNEDLRLMIAFLEQGARVLSIPHEGYHVVYRMGSNTRKLEKESFSRAYLDSVNNADRILLLVQKEYPEMSLEAEHFAAYQRLQYLLHIPISQMKKNNMEYKKIVKYIRKKRFSICKNPYLSKKNKLYLNLLSVAPRFVRIIHAKYRGL